MDKYIGIDISKQTFDGYGYSSSKNKEEFIKLNQTKKDFQKLIRLYGKDKVYVMEATGPYYMKLACFLYEKKIRVAVINPLIINRFSQMRMQRAKTDKKDAKTIFEYAFQQDVKLWEPPQKEVLQIQQMLTSINLIQKQRTATNNQLKAFESNGTIEPHVKKTLKTVIIKYDQAIEQLEKQMQKIVEKHYCETKERLESIPGIGKKTIPLLIAITNNFEKFIHYKQLIAYTGFSPRTFESGTSVKGKGHICKLGSAAIRKQLYMCAWSAKYHNKACIELYNRLKQKGKPEKVIKVAIANKLLKQAFSIVKNKTMYDPNYISINPAIN